MKKLFWLFCSMFLVACSSANFPHLAKSQFPPIQEALDQLSVESDILHGVIVQDYSIAKAFPHKETYSIVQQDKLLNANDFLFVPISQTTDTPIFESVELEPTLSGNTDIDQQYAFYSDPLRAAENLQQRESVTPYVLQKRAVTLDMANAVLTKFLEHNPQFKDKFESAAGYAVFDISSFSVVFYIGGFGDGVIFDKQTHKAIYANYFRAGTGFGAGYIDQYVIYVFHSRAAILQFIGLSGGMDVGASGTLGIWGKYFSFNPWIDTYQIYKDGANFQANWGAGLYWQSSDN